MKAERFGIAAAAALMLALAGCEQAAGQDEVSVPAFPLEIRDQAGPDSGLIRDDALPVIRDVYTRSIPEDVYSDAR